jgi:hypothetical protein
MRYGVLVTACLAAWLAAGALPAQEKQPDEKAEFAEFLNDRSTATVPAPTRSRTGHRRRR